MAKTEYKLSDSQEALYLFKNWLLSAMYLPNEIHKMTEINIIQHTLPIADIIYDFEVKWTADIGSFQKDKYNKRCESIRKRNAKKTSDKWEKTPSKSDSDFWYWQNNQHGVYKERYVVKNRPAFLYDSLSIEKNVVKEHIMKYVATFFNNYTNTESISGSQSVPDETDNNIAENSFEICKNTAVDSIQYPGDKQKNISTKFRVLNYSITRKYYPMFIFDFMYKEKTYVFCSDVTATNFSGKRPRANYVDEIIMGGIGFSSLITYLFSGILPIDEWSELFYIQSDTFEILLLIVAILGTGYVIISYLLELSKASARRKELLQYEMELKN